MATNVLTPEEYKQAQRSLTEKTLDKAASDPEWKQRYIDDPAAAIDEAGFPEIQQIRETKEQLKPLPQDEDVQGHDSWYYYEEHHVDVYDYSTVYWYYYEYDT
jgi:hypothetical protein